MLIRPLITALALAALALPARAEPILLSGSAELVDRTAAPGTVSAPFRLRVSLTAVDADPSPPKIAATIVVVSPPAGLVRPSAGSASGWSARLTAGRVVFEGGRLDPEVGQTFAVTASVADAAHGTTAAWRVQAGYDDGEQFVPLPAACGACLQLAIDAEPPAVETQVQGVATDPAFGEPEELATNGQPLTVTGYVTDHGEPCATCAAELVVRQYADDAGTEYLGRGTDITEALSMDEQGRLEGAPALVFHESTRSVRTAVQALDGAGNRSVGSDGFIPVDNTPPKIDAARTRTGGSGGTDFRSIDVALTEPVAIIPASGAPPATTSVGDWTVEGKRVQSVAFPNRETVRLTLASDLTGDQEPIVTYSPCGAATECPMRLRDRAGLWLADARVTAFDGLRPATPLVSGVDGRGPGPGGYLYTSSSSPSVTILPVEEGHVVRVMSDGVELCRAAGTPSLIAECSLPDLGRTERRVTLQAEAFDGPIGASATNRTAGPDAQLVLDFTPPRVTDFAVSDGAVTVTFDSELMSGRDFAIDWGVLLPPGSEAIPNSVSGSGSIRTIHFSGTAVPCGISYVLAGPPEERYRDPAGHVLADFDSRRTGPHNRCPT